MANRNFFVPDLPEPDFRTYRREVFQRFRKNEYGDETKLFARHNLVCVCAF